MRTQKALAAPTTEQAAEPPQHGAETLADLAAEATAAEPPQPGQGGAEAAPEIVQPAAPNDGLRFGCKALVKVLGGLACARAGVAPLAPSEVDAAGDALAGVAVYYLPTDGDPRMMAWLTLALTVGSIAAPRMRQAEEGTASAA